MKTCLLLYGCLLFFVFTPRRTAAFFLKQYTTNEKLVSNTVYHSFCDSKGYMWFCTDRGLSRFDGTNFKNFTTSDGLSDNEIFNAYEDKRGRVWFFTYNGEPCYYLRGKFYNSSGDSFLKRLPVLPYICDIYEEGDAMYWGYQSGEIVKIKNSKVAWLWKTKDKFWAFTKTGPSIVAIMNEKYCFIRNDTLVIKRTNIKSAYTEKDRVFIHRDAKVDVMEAGEISWTYNDPEWAGKFNEVLNVYADNKNNVLIGTRSGLIIINQKTGEKHKLLQHVAVSSIKQDVYQNYWITTLDRGIYYLNANFSSMNIYPDASCRLINSSASFFLQKSDSCFSLENREGYPSFQYVAPWDKSKTLPLYIDKEKLIYASINTHSVANRLNIYYRKDKRVEPIKFALDPHAVYTFQNDTFIVIDYESIFLAKLNVNGSYILKGLLGSKKIYKTCQVSDGKIYYTTTGQLHCYEAAINSSTVIDSFKHPNVIECLFAFNSWLIACDNKKQIHLYDLKMPGRKIELQSDYIVYSAEKIDSDKLLLNTQEGYVIAQINHSFPATISYRKLEYPFQYPNMQELYLQGDYVIGRAGNQLIYFKKNLLYKAFDIPLLYIEDINVNRIKYPGDPIRLANTVESDIQVLLSAVSNNQSLHYVYRIREDDHWGKWYSATTPELNILLSKAGSYTIEMNAVSSNHQRSAPKYITLDITPPFFRSNAFYFLLGFLMVCVLVLLLLFYIRKKKRAFQSELKHMQLEHKAVNALLNPHFVFNVVNNIQNLINSDAKESANNYLAIMSKMIRQNMENLQFDLIPIENELKLISNYIQLQNLRFHDRILLRIEHDPSNADDIYLPPLLLHTFVENAIIHGIRQDQSALVIQIDTQIINDNYLRVTITDNGKGLKKESVDSDAFKTSLGIDFNRNRLQRLSDFYKVNFQLEVRNRHDDIRGTEVVILFYAHLAQLMKSTT